MPNLTIQMSDRAVEGVTCVKIDNGLPSGSKNFYFETTEIAEGFISGVNMGLEFAQRSAPSPSVEVIFNGSPEANPVAFKQRP